MAWLLTAAPVPWWVAVLAGLAFTAAFGGIEGVIVTWLNVPSFVVTLAGCWRAWAC